MRSLITSILVGASLVLASGYSQAIGSDAKKSDAKASAPVEIETKVPPRPGADQPVSSDSELLRKGEELIKAGNLQEAAKVMEVFLKRFPASPLKAKVEISLAEIKFESFADKSVSEQLSLIDDLRAIIRNYPASEEAARAILKTGELYERIGYKYEAIASYKALIEQYREKPQVLKARRQLGLIFYRDANYASAAAEFLRLMDLEKDQSSAGRAAFMAANSFFKQKKFPQALNLYQKGLSANRAYIEDDPETIFNIGETYFHLKKYLLARDYYTKGLKLSPKSDPNNEYIARIGDTFLEEKNYKEALKIYATVMEKYPGSQGALISKVRMAGIGVDKPGIPLEKPTPYNAPYRDPIKAYKEVLKDNPNSQLAELSLLNISYIYSKGGKLADSLEALSIFLEEHPSSILRPRAVSQVEALMPKVIRDHRNRGDFIELLLAYYRMAPYLSEDFNDQEMDLGAAWALGKAGFSEKAIDLYKLIVARPINQEAKWAAILGLAEAYAGLQKLDQAEKSISSLPMGSLKGELLSKAASISGEILFKRAQYEKAAGEYAKAGSTAKEPALGAEHYRMAGESMIGAGKPAEALNFFKLSARLIDKLHGEAKVLQLKKDMLYEIADSAYRAGFADEALASYKLALAADPTHPSSSIAAYRVGEIYSKLYSATGNEEYMDKAKAATKGLTQDPKKDSIWGAWAAQLPDSLELMGQLSKYKGKIAGP